MFHRLRLRTRRAMPAILAVIALPSCAVGEAPPAAAAVDTNRTREAMRAIYAELSTLFPAAVSGALAAPERADEFGAAFRRMGTRAEALATHGSPLPTGSRMFAGVLSQDIRRAETFFERQNFDSAAFFVASIVEDCTACHTRRKAPDALVSRDFIGGASVAQLDLLERAAVAVATRRFGDGMGLYERAFTEPGTAPEALLGPLTSYLTVALRVQRDPQRAQAIVSKLAASPGLAAAVKADLEHWNETLRATAPGDLQGTTLAAAKNAVANAKKSQRYVADYRSIVDYLVASAQLHDLAARPQASPDDVAEIFELLGHAELGVAQNMWLSRADLYWENAIRLAPDSPAAQRAFATLEREVRAGFTGSGGLHLPADEAARLEELRALVSNDLAVPGDGGRLFAQHCALCHGADGRGYGPYALELMWVPADLTRIAARRGGEFPKQEVFGLIARRDPIGSHQSPEMPRWGEFWQDDSKIDALVAFLETLQRR